MLLATKMELSFFRQDTPKLDHKPECAGQKSKFIQKTVVLLPNRILPKSWCLHSPTPNLCALAQNLGLCSSTITSVILDSSYENQDNI